MNKKGIVIGIVGLGYVGLPTAIAFHAAGFKVHGIDINKSVVDVIKSGRSHLSDSSAELAVPAQSDNWNTTTEYSDVIPKCDVILITVPTPVNPDRTPNLGLVENAVRSVLNSMPTGKGKVIVVESTVFPGATMGIARKLEVEMGKDFPHEVKFAYSPERVSPGDVGKTAENIAKIVGANDEETGAMLSDVYGAITNKGCKFVGSIEVAEAAKMVENTQRDIDIAFVNELAKTLPRMGLDVMEVLDAASTKWNFHSHNPGIGVGGHCIPVDPYYYIQASKDAGLQSSISPVARQINESMPHHVADRISREINHGGIVSIFGLAYKPNVGDVRESPSMELIRILSAEGISTRAWDPMVKEDLNLPDSCIISTDPYSCTEGADLVVLATAHPACLEVNWERIRDGMNQSKLYDGPRSLRREELELLGFRYIGVGVPDEKTS